MDVKSLVLLLLGVVGLVVAAMVALVVHDHPGLSDPVAAAGTVLAVLVAVVAVVGRRK